MLGVRLPQGLKGLKSDALTARPHETLLQHRLIPRLQSGNHEQRLPSFGSTSGLIQGPKTDTMLVLFWRFHLAQAASQNGGQHDLTSMGSLLASLHWLSLINLPFW